MSSMLKYIGSSKYTGSSKTKFFDTANNHKSNRHKFKDKKNISHFCKDDHKGIPNWIITLIAQVDDGKFIRQRELFWAHKLDTFYPMA